MKVIPPNFGYVEEGIFRCGAPEPRHYGFLASLGLRTCILLTDIHDGAFVHWLQETGVMIFCPLSSEAPARGVNVRAGGVRAYSTVNDTDKNNRSDRSNIAFSQSRGSGMREGATSMEARSTNGGNNNNTASRDERREVSASPNSGFGDAFSPDSGSGRLRTVGSSYKDNDGGNNDGADGVDGGFDGNGNYNGEEGSIGNKNNNRGTVGAMGTNSGGWGSSAGNVNSSNNGATTPGTSNAVRFLQENGVERQFNTKFSPVLQQEPVFFPGDARSGGGNVGSNNGGVPYQFVAAPSYEGRLHGLMTLSEAVVVSILHIMLDPRYYPLLITCSKGRYRTGIVCGCLRKLQGWNLVSILEEYRRFAGNKSRADNEEFIELFDEELVNLELPDGRRPTILYNM